MTISLALLPLPSGVRSSFIDCPSVNLNFHYLESQRQPSKGSNGSNLILLLHGYPDLAFSWRKVIPLLSSSTADNYHIVAPDLRGYGRTTGWDNSEWAQTNLHDFSGTTLVRDIVAFVRALGYTKVHALIGHDFGAVAASLCALIRPDMFTRLVLMSHPFKPLPDIPEAGTAHDSTPSPAVPKPDIDAELAALSNPRMHYRTYNSTQRAAIDWLHPPQGLHAFLRGYIHVKSADWARNEPVPLGELSGAEMARLPEYYVMPLGSTFPDVVASLMDGEDVNATKKWLSDDELAVYVQEWTRTGFQGGLNWYRAKGDTNVAKDLLLYAGSRIAVPTVFISGKQDWGNHQEPGVLEKMTEACEDGMFRGCVFVNGAGHWPQQEKPARVVEEIVRVLETLG